MTASAWRRRLRANWKLGVLTALLLPLLVGLGCWQLLRAEQKTQWLQQRQAQAQRAPVPLVSLVQAKAEKQVQWNTARRVIVEGVWLPQRTLLLDNQIVQGRVGYDVITPLRLAATGQLVLVNRGWLPAPPRREQLPAIPAAGTAGKVVRFEARLHRPAGEPFVLQEIALPKGWPKVIQTLEPDRLQAHFEAPLLPFSVRLARDTEAALSLHWQDSLPMGPERHLGYAVQWFALAVTLAGLSGWVLWRNPGIEERQEKREGSA